MNIEKILHKIDILSDEIDTLNKSGYSSDEKQQELEFLESLIIRISHECVTGCVLKYNLEDYIEELQEVIEKMNHHKQDSSREELQLLTIINLK